MRSGVRSPLAPPGNGSGSQRCGRLSFFGCAPAERLRNDSADNVARVLAWILSRILEVSVSIARARATRISELAGPARPDEQRTRRATRSLWPPPAWPKWPPPTRAVWRPPQTPPMNASATCRARRRPRHRGRHARPRRLTSIRCDRRRADRAGHRPCCLDAVAERDVCRRRGWCQARLDHSARDFEATGVACVVVQPLALQATVSSLPRRLAPIRSHGDLEETLPGRVATSAPPRLELHPPCIQPDEELVPRTTSDRALRSGGLCPKPCSPANQRCAKQDVKSRNMNVVDDHYAKHVPIGALKP